MKQETNKKIERIMLAVYFDNNDCAIVRSPKKKVRIGIRTRIGWRIALIGILIIFGDKKKFRIILNPLFPDPPIDC